MNGEIKVGIFVLAGFVLFCTAIFLLGDYSFQKFYPVYVEFTDVAGLPDKALVKLSGVEVGKIKKISLKHDKVIVELAVREGVQIYRDSKDSARVMAISVHPYIMGAPHRVKYFRKIFEKIRKKKDVLFWTGEQIADWFVKVGPKAPGV